LPAPLDPPLRRPARGNFAKLRKVLDDFHEQSVSLLSGPVSGNQFCLNGVPCGLGVLADRKGNGFWLLSFGCDFEARMGGEPFVDASQGALAERERAVFGVLDLRQSRPADAGQYGQLDESELAERVP
jgi:hypothetical protein